MDLDFLDRQIINHLQDDGRVNFVTLAEKLEVSEGTIRKRVRRLEKNRIVQTIGITDPFKVGLDTMAFLWVEVDRNKIDSVIRSLESLDEVHYLVVTTGSHDLVAMVVLPDRDHLIRLLNEQLPGIDGIISTETSIVLQVHKQLYSWKPFGENSTDGEQADLNG